jgi:dTDP-4-amino-4,6-dideoxygalactose transaminase
VDVDPQTWQPSVASARAALEADDGSIAGLLLANVFGVGNPDIGAWEELASECGLPLVIDSAAGFGSRYADDEHVGGRGDCEIFSFHATKPFAIGEGGALVSRNPEITDRALDFQNFGFDKTRECLELGMNAKLQEISAAIGIRQLAEFDTRLAGRRDVLHRYSTGLRRTGLQFQPNADASSLCFASALCTSTEHKVSVMKSLLENGIQARDYYNPPQHLHPYFEANREFWRSTELSVTNDVCSRIVSLPIHDQMATDDIDRVIGAVRRGSI